MSYFQDDKHVLTCDAIVLWDGITRPDTKDDGSQHHNIRVAVPGNAPEFQELTQVATAALNESKWKGQLPPKGNWPLNECDATKFGPLVQGHMEFSAKTTRGCPPVYGPDGKELPNIAFAQSFYAGAKVRLLVHAYDYDNVNKGIGFGLDGIQVVDTNAPRLDVGGGMSSAQVAQAFGATAPAPAPAAPAPAPAAPAPAPAAPAPAPAAPAPAPDFLNPPTPTPGFTMTAAANGFTRDQMHAAGWTDEQLIAQGMMTQS